MRFEEENIALKCLGDFVVLIIHIQSYKIELVCRLSFLQIPGNASDPKSSHKIGLEELILITV